MDPLISLALFMSLWGTLLASQTKVSVCASSLRPSRDSGKELGTCCIRDCKLVFEKRGRTPLFCHPRGPRVFCLLPHYDSLFKTSRNRCLRDAQSQPVSLSVVSVSPHLQKSGASFTLCQTESSLKTSRVLFDCDLLSHSQCCGARWNKASHFVQEWLSVAPCAVTSLK